MLCRGHHVHCVILRDVEEALMLRRAGNAPNPVRLWPCFARSPTSAFHAIYVRRLRRTTLRADGKRFTQYT
jgi:hypothetical protein